MHQVEQVAQRAPSATKGTRLDALWSLPSEWATWALAERADWTAAEVERVALVFRDHWHGKAGKDGRKADWLATWRNWVRNERRNYVAPAEPLQVVRRVAM